MRKKHYLRIAQIIGNNSYLNEHGRRVIMPAALVEELAEYFKSDNSSFKPVEFSLEFMRNTK